MVVGGGPAGLTAAATAAQRGHSVTLWEAAPRLGGQANLAALLPGRTEFGGIVTNLAREAERAQVHLRLGARVTPELISREAPDAVILATGALPFRPDLVTDGEMAILTAWDVLEGGRRAGARVVVADWRGDWIGPGIAEALTLAGSRVTLAVAGTHAGESLPLYVRDTLAARLHRLGVEVRPYLRLFGTAGDTVFLQHTAGGDAVEIEGVDTLVASLGHVPRDDLAEPLRALGFEVHAVGDALAPRTAEEAVFDGLRAGVAV
jgi:NADPH-dependent 2,4-dienoyl-CoA reductase/sulfur reductase-like enzyme